MDLSNRMNNPIIHLVLINADEENIYHIYISFIKLKKGWVIKPPKRYRIRKDRAHTPDGKDHIHIYTNDEFVVINNDGSRRHNTNEQFRLPRKLCEWLKENFPYYNIPANCILKSKNVPTPLSQFKIFINLIDNIISTDDDDLFSILQGKCN